MPKPAPKVQKTPGRGAMTKKPAPKSRAPRREKLPPDAVGRAIAEELSGLELDFYRGNAWALMHAVRQACRYGVPLPSGLMRELEAGLERFLNREELELGKALGIEPHRKVAKWRRRHRRDPGTGTTPFMGVLSRFHELEQAWPKGRAPKRTEIKKQVAKEFRISPRSVDEIFREAARVRRLIAAENSAAQKS
jgi:hypothetical protein